MLDKNITDQSVLKSIENVLASRPELASRIDSILEIVDEPNRNGEIRSDDEVESLLVQELRKLGKTPCCSIYNTMCLNTSPTKKLLKKGCLWAAA